MRDQVIVGDSLHKVFILDAPIHIELHAFLLEAKSLTFLTPRVLVIEMSIFVYHPVVVAIELIL